MNFFEKGEKSVLMEVKAYVASAKLRKKTTQKANAFPPYFSIPRS